MRTLVRALIIGTLIVASGCVIVPEGPPRPYYYHCGWYHCR